MKSCELGTGEENRIEGIWAGGAEEGGGTSEGKARNLIRIHSEALGSQNLAFFEGTQPGPPAGTNRGGITTLACTSFALSPFRPIPFALSSYPSGLALSTPCVGPSYMYRYSGE